MSDIKNIATYINSLLTESAAGSNPGGHFQGKPFQKGKFSGVAELIKKNTGDDETSYTIPIIENDKGTDGTEVTIDDIYPFQLYHRIKGIETSDADISDSFGNGSEKLITFDMVLIVFSDKRQNEIDASEYITALTLDFPKTINSSNVTGSQFSKCEINLTETIIDKSEVLNQEYNRDDLDVKQSYVCISFGYEVQLTYDDECFTLC